MQNPDPANEAPHQEVNESKIRRPDIMRDPKRFSGFVGYALLGLSASFGFGVILMPRADPPKAPGYGNEIGWFLHHYSDTFLSIFLVVFFALVGLRLLGAAGTIAPKAIPSEDRALLEPLVREANKEAINQYVILSSLSGLTGTFQKIGFSGLPLATSVLTLLFCALSFANRDFLEFAKLTLGAFIGSFVQGSANSGQLKRTGVSGDLLGRDQK